MPRTKAISALSLIISAIYVIAPFSSASADEGSGVSTPTYSKEISRILQDNCAGCHRPGIQFTPMALTDYKSVRPWAKSIKKAVSERSMPPWHADPAYGDFKNDISLADADIDSIVRWVDAGAPRGNPSDLPAPRVYSEEGWQIGEPDVIIDMGRDFEVPADGTVPYRFFAVKTDFAQDMWVQAMEAKAGNLNVVHHIVIYVRNPRDGVPDHRAGQLGQGLLGALSPGNTPSVYLPGQGKLIKKGATLIFNMHYNTNGIAQTDRSYVGLKLHREPVKQRVITRGVANMGFAIPPNENNFEIRSEFTFDQDSTLISIMPHMHLRGKDFKYSLFYPDGSSETILSVPKYNFDWQVYYHYDKPIKMPAGTRMECVAHMDNSSENPQNPNPNETVTFGPQTWEEMMIGWIDYVHDDEDISVLSAQAINAPDYAAAGGE